MPSTIQRTANMLFALVQNAKTQAIARQNRRVAMDVLQACSLYAKGVNFPCEPDMFKNLAASIVDKQNGAIIEEFSQVEKFLANMILSTSHDHWRTMTR